jgi:hypothetical protein
MEKFMNLLQVTNDAALRLPESAWVNGPPVVMALNRHAITGQIKAMAAFPIGAKDCGYHDRTRGPLRRSQRPAVQNVPRLRRHRALAVAGALKPEAKLHWRPGPLWRRYRNNSEWPVRAHMPPPAIDLAAPELNGGKIVTQ